jgi:hypothetical protein
MNQKEFEAMEALKKENAELKKQLAEKPVVQKAVRENTLAKDAKVILGMYRLNVSNDFTKKVIGYNPETNKNEYLTRKLDILSAKNDFYDYESEEGRKKFFTSKAIDKSGLYIHPTYGVVYCSIDIHHAARRIIYALDRAGAQMVKAQLENTPKDQWVTL